MCLHTYSCSCWGRKICAEENGMYIREQIQFEWISSKLKMVDLDYLLTSFSILTYSLPLSSHFIFSILKSFFFYQFFNIVFFLMFVWLEWYFPNYGDLPVHAVKTGEILNNTHVFNVPSLDWTCISRAPA